MKFEPINIQIVAGVVQSGGRVNTFDTGNSIANFIIATDSWRRDPTGGVKRIVEYHNIQVRNIDFDDLYELVKEGNIVFVKGKSASYKTGNVVHKYVLGEDVSLIRSISEKTK